MLPGITLLCFFASYTVALIVEFAKLWGRTPWHRLAVIGFAGAGLIAHSIYLYNRMNPAEGEPGLLSNWYQWCLVVAWVLMGAYLGLKFARPEMAIGLFMLPLVLALIAIARIFQKTESFSNAAATQWWGLFHGVALLFGTVSVLIAFVAGLMYLVQSSRLRQIPPPQDGLELPSLEWLERLSSRSLVISTIFLAIGLVSGVVMNLTRSTPLPWTDAVIVSSGVLFLWLICCTIFEFAYRPAQQGQKVAYLTVAHFLFLCLAVGFALWAGHGGTSEKPSSELPPSAREEAGR